MTEGQKVADGFWRRLLGSTPKENAVRKLDEEAQIKLRTDGFVRRHYTISGRVQGVGLRYTVFYLAEELNLTGWVLNLADGRVELELQGKADAVERLACSLDGRGRISIAHMEEEERPLLEETGFCVRG